MLVQQGEERGNDVDQRLACTLAAVAGALNTAAFEAVGFFAANMTGNVSLLSDHIAVGHFLTGSFFLAIILTFIAGSVVSTVLVNFGRRRQIHGIYAYSILSEAILLAVLGFADVGLPPLHRAPTLVLGISFLMGLQNAVVTRISGARVRTTHVSGTATDIGIELGMLIDIMLGHEPNETAAPYWAKLRLHGMSILSFLIGGVVGVLVYQRIGGLLLIATAVLLLVIAVSGIRRARGLRARAAAAE
ncbi:YoaK family protein [Tardiphaga sp.]|uniref:YoaK family protein n=1 Tax=Tardiphaga sp. TaxID=1926292 RepID=UPI0025F181DC|nr:YoaK family protein [Tardiphaga sp.]